MERKVTMDVTRVAEEVSPTKMSILLLYMCTYRQIHCCHTSLTLVTQEVERYKEHAYSNPIEMVGNPLGWWKQHGSPKSVYRVCNTFLGNTFLGTLLCPKKVSPKKCYFSPKKCYRKVFTECILETLCALYA